MVTKLFTEVLLGVRVRTFGDHVDGRSLLLMNHRTHLDWLFLWSVLARYGNLDHWKPIMKSSLKHIPLYGKCAYVCVCVCVCVVCVFV